MKINMDIGNTITIIIIQIDKGWIERKIDRVRLLDRQIET